MTPSTIKRIARLYEDVVGYDPISGGWTASEALETLREMRTAATFSPHDPSAYHGIAMRKPMLKQVKAMLDQAAALKARNIGRPSPSLSDAIEAKRLCRRAAELQHGMI